MKTQSGGLFSRLRSNPALVIFTVVLLVCLAVMGFIVAQLLSFSQKDQQLKANLDPK